MHFPKLWIMTSKPKIKNVFLISIIHEGIFYVVDWCIWPWKCINRALKIQAPKLLKFISKWPFFTLKMLIEDVFIMSEAFLTIQLFSHVLLLVVSREVLTSSVLCNLLFQLLGQGLIPYHWTILCVPRNSFTSC